jgi:hypothetical protein
MCPRLFLFTFDMHSSKLNMSNANSIRTIGTLITTDDLERILQVFDIAARRGAFTVEEFPEIGSLHSKVKNFIATTSGSNSTNIICAVDSNAKPILTVP